MKSILTASLIVLLTAPAFAAESELSLESGPGRAGPLVWEHLALEWTPAADGGVRSGRARLTGIELGALPADWLAAAGLRELSGQADATVELGEDGVVNAGVRVREAGFDSSDGTLAAAGLALDVHAQIDPDSPGRAFSLEIVQHAGELLVGALYLPPPAAPVTVSLAGVRPGPDELRLERFTLDDPGALTASGRLMFERGEHGWRPARVALDGFTLQLPAGWRRWLDGPVAAAGFADMETAGSVRGSGQWRPGELPRVKLALEAVDLRDPAGRLEWRGLTGDIAVAADAVEVALDWDSLGVHALPTGASGLRLNGDARRLRSTAPVRLPLLDGAVVIDDLVWRRPADAPAALELDARIEPLSLSELTAVLGWPEFGGRLAGEFPGIVYADQRLAFSGGMQLEAFDGRIDVDGLVIERPLGSLPALAADIRFDRLDLLALTGAFDFGRMEGRLSGRVADLRLLDWRPAAMDARVYTHDDAPGRRISQRAVENLSRLGGAGGALVSGTLLRIFDDFPYARAGLACRLSNNICHMDGVAAHESGGFYILQGRALPRLDIVGHRRLVDWPQLLGQLVSMLE